ncbi:AAA family ATPase [Aeromonas hydrophila]|uniref:AAA family ATPase n=1 Tax=Aeromonas hydrophila TaxID=644 RepID=UPI002B4A4550|nr:AAA family ATPase [Aeromonas hydrophila]
MIDNDMAFILGKQDELLANKSILLLESEDIKNRIALSQPMKDFIGVLSERTIEKTLAIYNDLLTAIVRDVMLSDNERIYIDAIVNARNKLEVSIVSERNGHVEDVSTSRGGSIKSIIGAAMRFISIALSGNRRFVVFDEVDSFLKKEYVPAFANVLGRLASEIGVQCIYISHHDPELFESHARVVEILKSDAGLKVNIAHEGPQATPTRYFFNADLVAGYIRSITLTNIVNYKEAVVPLSPGLTVITGDNDIGKSSLVYALDGLISKSRQSHLISHEQTVGTVSLSLEDENVLTYAINNKNETVVYTLTDKDGSIVYNEAVPRGGEIPAWIDNYLCMPVLGDSNLYISQQMSAPFIVDPSLSASKRAELVDLGELYCVFLRLVSEFNEDQKNLKRDLKNKLSELDVINKKLEMLRPIHLIEELSGSLQQLHKKKIEIVDALKVVDSVSAGNDDSRTLLDSYSSVSKLILENENIATSLERISNNSVLLSDCTKSDATMSKAILHSLSGFDFSLSMINERFISGANFLLGSNLDGAISSHDLAAIGSVANGANSIKSMLSDVASLLEAKETLDATVHFMPIANSFYSLMQTSKELQSERIVSDVLDLDKLSISLSSMAGDVSQIKNDINHVNEHLHNTEDDVNNLLSQNGGSCPLCHSSKLPF